MEIQMQWSVCLCKYKVGIRVVLKEVITSKLDNSLV